MHEYINYKETNILFLFLNLNDNNKIIFYNEIKFKKNNVLKNIDFNKYLGIFYI